MNVIQLENVSKSYGKNKALDNLSLKVQEGEIYGFIGPNGAGKSTTIRLILNFLKSDSGAISVFGLDPSAGEIEIKKQTGYVSSETFMYPDMKVKEIFRFTSSYYKVDATEKIKTLIQVLDIDINKRFEELSFGNRKKVAIACAMLHSPKLIILDEPSNGLDPVIRTHLYSLLKEEQNNGTTIFFSSHVLGEVRKVSTRIGLLKEGKLIKEVSASEFTKTGYCKVSVDSADISSLKALEGVVATEQHGNHHSFIYSGRPDVLLKTLSAMSIESVLIEEPDPETVFMHYFQH